VAVDFLLSPDLVIGKDVFVQGSLIGDNLGNVFSNVSQVCHACSVRAILSNDGGGKFERIVNLARRQRRKRDLIPQTDIDDGVGEIDFLDMVDNVFFL
jgi:hypothetical protein